jgi:hypothetical protein
VDTDLVAFRHDAALLVLVQQRGDRRHEEARLHVVALQQGKDARHADAGAVLAPGHSPDRAAPVAQLVRLVVAVERERDRAAPASRPGWRAIRSAGADLLDQSTPAGLGPLPGLVGLRAPVHMGLLSRPPLGRTAP